MGDFASAVSKIKPKGVIMDATPEILPGKIIYRDCTKEEVEKVAPRFAKARTRDAEVTLRGGRLVWIRGTWISGTFDGGYWMDGTWKDGTWLNGIWRKGTWVKGMWKQGIWTSGTWLEGKWEAGVRRRKP
jgi:hypothetical protein